MNRETEGRTEIRLTQEQIDRWNALEEVSRQELAAQVNETPEQREASIERIFREVIGPHPPRTRPVKKPSQTQP